MKKDGNYSYETISEKSETYESNEGDRIEEFSITESSGYSRTECVK